MYKHTVHKKSTRNSFFQKLKSYCSNMSKITPMLHEMWWKVIKNQLQKESFKFTSEFRNGPYFHYTQVSSNNDNMKKNLGFWYENLFIVNTHSKQFLLKFFQNVHTDIWRNDPKRNLKLFLAGTAKTIKSLIYPYTIYTGFEWTQQCDQIWRNGQQGPQL